MKFTNSHLLLNCCINRQTTTHSVQASEQTCISSELTVNAQCLFVEERHIRCTIFRLAAINRLIIGDVCNDVQFRLHSCADLFRLCIDLDGMKEPKKKETRISAFCQWNAYNTNERTHSTVPFCRFWTKPKLLEDCHQSTYTSASDSNQPEWQSLPGNRWWQVAMVDLEWKRARKLFVINSSNARLNSGKRERHQFPLLSLYYELFLT